MDDVKIDEKGLEARISMWTNAYKRTADEIEELKINFDCIKDRDNFQALALGFFSIHLCNYFVFTVRQVFGTLEIPIEFKQHILDSFKNAASSPSVPTMERYLAIIRYYTTTDNLFFDDLLNDYKTLLPLRNKYAHADTTHESIKNIRFDQSMFIKCYENIKKLEGLCLEV